MTRCRHFGSIVIILERPLRKQFGKHNMRDASAKIGNFLAKS